MALIPEREQKSQKVKLTEDNANRCLCPGCPTFNSSDCPGEKGEKIFCSIGATSCEDLAQVGCDCGDCPIFTENNLKVGYFCVYGESTETGEPASQPEES